MRWLVIGGVSAAVAEALGRHGQTAVLPESLELAADAEPDAVLAAATKAQLELLTADPALARAALGGGARFGRSVVLLSVGDGEVEQDDAIDRLFARYKRLSAKRLYTVTPTRVKIRQLGSS